MWISWCFLANVSLLFVEYLYRNGSYPTFVDALPFIAIPMMLGQIGLFYCYRAAPSLLLATAVFTLMNNLCRLCSVHRLGESVCMWNYLGIICMMMGVFLLGIKS